MFRDELDVVFDVLWRWVLFSVFILLPLAGWKAAEILWWFMSHITWK